MTIETKNNNNNNEVNILAIIWHLWHGKKTIVITVLIGVILASVYLNFTKEKWTSTAIITKPQLGQLSNFPMISTTIDPINSKNISSNVFTNFVSRISAETLNFLPERPLEIKPTTSGSNDTFTVSFSDETAINAQKSLISILKKINRQTSNNFYYNANKAIRVKILSTNTILDSQIRTAQEKKIRRLNTLTESLKVAKATNTKHISVNEVSELSDDMLFLLGERALNTLIINEDSWPLYLNDSYYSNKETLQILKNIKLNDSKIDYFESFSFVQKPSLPIINDSPKKALVLTLFALLSCLVSFAIIFIRILIHYVKNKKSII